MTRKPRLLIVDDELDILLADRGETRRAMYERLAEEFELSFLESPATLHATLERRHFDAMLIDFVLEDWRMDARDIVKEVRDTVPVALISKSWSTNLDKLSATIAAFPIARLFTWDDMASARSREIVTFWINAAIRARHGNLAVVYGADEPLRIVQFSDMQFNAINGKRYETDTQVAIQTIQSHWGDPPHFLSLPGDIAEAGRPSEYAMARGWIETLRKRLGQDRYEVEVLTAPGNHDVCWPLALAQRIDAPNKVLASEAPLFPELASYAFAPFRDFSRAVEPAQRWSGSRSYWVSGAYRRAGLILFGINSSEDLSDWGIPSRKLSDATMASLFAEICEIKREVPHAIVVGLMHHPLDQSNECIINSVEFKRNISELTGSIVLLTGHVHEEATTLTANANRPGVLQIGSPTFTLASRKRPEDSLRGFNLIEFGRQNDIVVGVIVQTYAIVGHQLKLLSTSRYKHERGRISDALEV